MFGSGASHDIYAQFIKQTKLADGGRSMNILCPAGTRMASFFYVLLRLLCLSSVLAVTIYQAKFTTILLVKTDNRAKEIVQDIQDPQFWKAVYQLLPAVYPALHTMRVSESSKLAMSKLYILSHRLKVAF